MSNGNKPREGSEFTAIISQKEWDENIIATLYVLKVAAEELEKLWDHTGTNMVEGYPKCLPSWDEFVAQVNEWYRTQQRIRRADDQDQNL